MKLYIYSDVVGITDNYHNGGGLVIITDRAPATVWHEHVDALPKSSGMYPENIDPDALEGKLPDLVVGIVERPERIFIFPDSGCC